jgi:hypothetical protein
MRSRYLFAGLIAAGLALVISLPSPADEAPSKEKIDKLIEQMGSDDFKERDKATKDLSAIGVPALEALRKAAKSDDAEVRKRAEEIIPKIETQAESARILAPKRVHLVYKDTPLSEAVADFQKKSGYNIHLHDPDGKLKERKITLDTGDTTFWHALELFCAKAELTEGTMQDLMVPPGGGGAIGASGAPPVPQPPQRIQPLPIKKPAPPTPPPPAKGPRRAAEKPAPAPAVKPLPAQAAVPPARGAIALPVRRIMPFMPGTPGQIILKDGKSKQLPTDDRSAIRVRALDKSEMFGNAPEGEIILPLEVSPEPRLQWQAFQSIRIDKAVDDQDQKLTHIVPQVEGGGAGLGAAQIGIALPGGVAGPAFARPIMMWGGSQQQVPVQLKKGEKAAKSLKELKGVITAQLLTEERPLMTVAKLKAGETSKGDVGGSIKIVEVKSEEKQTTIRLEFEQPPFDKVVPAQPQMGMPGMPGIGVPIRAPRRGVRILPAPAQPAPAPAVPPPALAAQAPAPPAPAQAPAQAPPVQIQIGGGGIAIGGPIQFVGAPIINGLSIQDDKGNALPMQIRQTQVRAMQQGAIFVQTFIYTFVCQHDKDKGQPAKVVYLGRKRATVEIPFTLKDVPLP